MGRSASRWAVSWTLPAALAVGLALRLWGLGFGLPHTEARPDESLLLHRAVSICAGDLNPHFFNYPSFHLYLLALACALYYVGGRALGDFAGVDDFLLHFLLDPSGLYLTGRALTAAMGTASVAAVYCAGRNLGGSTTGAAASLMMSCAFLHVRDSHFMTVDVPATMWVTVAYCFLGDYVARPRRQRRLVVGAALAGLAASAKYNLGLFLPAVLYVAGHGPGLRTGQRLQRIACAGGVWAAAFLAGSPFIVLDPVAFWRDFTFEWHHFGRGHGAELGNGWLYQLTVILRHGLGWPLLVAAVASLGWMAWRRRPQDVAILLGLGGYYAVAGSGASHFARYAMPLVPLLCIAAGAGVARLWESRPAVAVAAAALLALSPALSSVSHDRLLGETDTRVLASRWIERHVPADDTIGFTGSSYGQPQLRRTATWLRERLEDVRGQGAPGRRLQLALARDASLPGPRYYTVDVAERPSPGMRSSWAVVPPKELHQRGMDWLVTQTHPLAYAAVPAALQTGMATLEPAADFDPDPLGQFDGTLYDPIDAFYAPFAGFGTVERTGPRIRVYRLALDH